MVRARFAFGLGVLLPLIVHATPARSGGVEESIRSLMARAEEGPSVARADALEKLGRIREKARLREFGVVEFLLRFIRNGRHLARLRNKAVVALIAVARDTDTSVREDVLEALVHVLEAPGEKDSVRWRLAAEIWTLVDPKGLGADRRAVAALEHVASGREPPAVRTAALRSLGRIGAARSLEVIRSALRDKDKDVRRAAMEALEEYLKTVTLDAGDRSALGKIVAELIDDSTYPVPMRAFAIKVLARMKYAPAVPRIEKLLRGEEDEALVLAGVEALGIFAGPGTAKTVAGVYRRFDGSEGARIRAAACAVLGDMYPSIAGTRNAAGTVKLVTDCLLEALYEDESVEVARAAAFGLGNLAICKGAPRAKAIEALIEALADSDGQVRKNARESLEELTLHAIPPRENETPEEYQRRWKEWYERNKRRFPG